MADEGEGFLRRWARRKTESRQATEPVLEPLAEPLTAPLSSPLSSPISGPISGPMSEPVAGLPSAPADLPLPAARAAMPSAEAPAHGVAARLPTMDDVAQLTPESDFSAFVARGVDQAVRRGALKKLFADPHFQVLDRLDMYMDDYNKPSPMPDDMLAALKHSKSFFDSLAGEAGDVPSPAPAPRPESQDTTTTTPPEQETL